jgi:hypothetical protein
MDGDDETFGVAGAAWRHALLEGERRVAAAVLGAAGAQADAVERELALFFDGPESKVALEHFGTAPARDAAQACVANALLDECVARATLAALPDASDGAIVVGAGMAGLSVGAALSETAPVAILERSAHVGGVWRLYANSTSRVNSSEPAYRLCGDRWTNHTRYSEVVRSIAMFVHRHRLQFATRCECTRVAPAPGGKLVHANWRGAAVAVASGFVALCTNRRLGVPRDLRFDGQEGFGGAVLRGLCSDVQGHGLSAADVVIVGMGAFAIENVRTALEGGAATATIVCRRRGAVCPHIVDWANFIRPLDAAFCRSAAGNAIVLAHWKRTYELTRAAPPECWRERLLKPDGHTVSVSDIYFLGTHSGHVATRLGAVRRLGARAVHCTDGTVLGASHVIACVGFEANTANKAICGTPQMRAIGLVDEHLWVTLESHLDAGALSGMFGSSYLSYVQFAAKLIRASRSAPSVLATVLAEPSDADMDSFTTGAVMGSIKRMAERDATVRDLLRAHVDEVRRRAHDSMSPEAYLAWNEGLWRDIERLLAAPRLEYPFADLWQQLRRVDALDDV